MKKSLERRAHIRFSEAEYLRVCSDANIYGETVPGIVKAVYFSKLPATPNFTKEDAIRIATTLNRLGNNVNQIAKHLNSGFRSGFNPALDDIADQLRALKQFALGSYGSC